MTGATIGAGTAHTSRMSSTQVFSGVRVARSLVFCVLLIIVCLFVLLSYLSYLCFLAYSGVQNILLCFVFLRLVASFSGFSFLDSPFDILQRLF
jgi:hypothetical protein